MKPFYPKLCNGCLGKPLNSSPEFPKCAQCFKTAMRRALENATTAWAGIVSDECPVMKEALRPGSVLGYFGSVGCGGSIDKCHYPFLCEALNGLDSIFRGNSARLPEHGTRARLAIIPKAKGEEHSDGARK